MALISEHTRKKWHDIIFEADTIEGKAFDIALMILIMISVLVVMLDSVNVLHEEHGPILVGLEWGLTILFTIEYIARIITSRDTRAYIFSYFGIIDLLAILPTYISLFIAGTQYLLIIRVLRLMRVFRILKLIRFVGASQSLALSLNASKYKILVFLGAVLMIVTVMGSVMYLVEGPANGFRNIPTSIYWAIVTLTTVGYGDIAPQTALGQAIASIIMILGYGIIAVPTGIITVEMTRQSGKTTGKKGCPHCGQSGQPDNARFCHSCGTKLQA